MTIDPNKMTSSPVSDVVMQMESTNEFGEKIRVHNQKIHPNTKVPLNLLPVPLYNIRRPARVLPQPHEHLHSRQSSV